MSCGLRSNREHLGLTTFGRIPSSDTSIWLLHCDNVLLVSCKTHYSYSIFTVGTRRKFLYLFLNWIASFYFCYWLYRHTQLWGQFNKLALTSKIFGFSLKVWWLGVNFTSILNEIDVHWGLAACISAITFIIFLEKKVIYFSQCKPNDFIVANFQAIVWDKGQFQIVSGLSLIHISEPTRPY